jgi:hypothetical protein
MARPVQSEYDALVRSGFDVMMATPRSSLPLLSPVWRATGSLRGARQRLFALCLAALVLVSTLAAGRTYLWCSMMEQRVETCCCASERSDVERGGDTRPELRSRCCETHGEDALTAAGIFSSAIEIPPAVVAVAPPAPALTVAIPSASYAPVLPQRAVRTSPIRAGPRTASATCARLQVFRC